MPASVISLQGLSHRYGQRKAVQELSLEVPEGCLFGFLGPNGAGKTTTIRVMLGFLRPDEGQAQVLGRDCWRESPIIKREVGYVPGDLRLYSWMTGREALKLVGQIRGQELMGQGQQLMDRFCLDPGLPVSAMSKGTRQKLGLVLALAHRPRLVVLDEPTSGLDPLMQDELARCLREMSREGRTIFFSCHSLPEVEQLCDRVAIMREGRLMADESLSSLRAQAPREVRLTFRQAAPTELPQGLRPLDTAGTTWRCELTGPMAPFLEWVASVQLEDLILAPPNLESIFRGFYTSP